MSMLAVYRLIGVRDPDGPGGPEEDIMNHCAFTGRLPDDPSDPPDETDDQSVSANQFEQGAHALIEPIHQARI